MRGLGRAASEAPESHPRRDRRTCHPRPEFDCHQHFLPYAMAFAVMVFVVIFAHTYIFGLLAHLDPSGRTNASTPTMLMMGTAIGPVAGGFVAQNLGYSSVGFVAGAAAWCGAVYASCWESESNPANVRLPLPKANRWPPPVLR
jgi:hypothetical protein